MATYPIQCHLDPLVQKSLSSADFEERFQRQNFRVTI